MKKIIFLLTMLLMAATAWSLPVELTHHPTLPTTKWYQIKTQDNDYLYYESSTNRFTTSSSPSTDDTYLFCFVGDEADSSNVIIYNRGRQRYMVLGDMNDIYGAPYLNHIEWNSDGSFYIYFWYKTYKYYVGYISNDGNMTTMNQPGESSYTAVEVETTPLVTTPYFTISPKDFHIPHNTLSNTGDQGYANLIDQYKGSKWCVENNSGQWETIWLDFETELWFTPNGYILTTGNDTKEHPERNPKEWVIYGKTLEDDDWTELVHVTDGEQAGLGTQNTTDYSFDITGLTEGYRYFRFEVRQINGADANGNYFFQLAELQFIGTYVDPPEIHVEPTLTSTDFHVPHNTLSNTGNEGYAKLIDQDKTTKWRVSNNSGQWETIWLDFESDVWFIPKGYTLTTGDDTGVHPERNPKEWVIYGKTRENDDWTEVVHVTDGEQAGLGTTSTTDYSFDIMGTTEAYRYFRFEVRQINGKDSDNNFTFQLAELMLQGTYVDVPEIYVEPTLTSTDFLVPHNVLDNTGNEGYAKLIDKDKSSKWCVSNNTGSWETIWLDFESDVWFIPKGYILTTGGDTGPRPERNPKEWVIYGKTFGDDDWTELVHVTDGEQAGLGTQSATDFSFDITGLTEGYRYFRFEVRQINGADANGNYIFQLAELTLRGKQVDPPTQPIPGDVTSDGTVDVSDVNAIINMMLGKATQTDVGDVTGDGNVDVSDVNAVINIMLGKTTPVTPPVVNPTAQMLTAIGYNVPHNGIDNEGNEGYAKLVDGNKSTKWCVENRSGAWETIWVDLKSDVAFTPTSYIMTTGGDTNSFYTRNPKNWKIYGRNSESESWTELAHVSDGSGLGTASTTDYTFEFNGVTKAYQYYRFEVIEIGGADRWNSSYYVFQLAELTLMGVAAQ